MQDSPDKLTNEAELRQVERRLKDLEMEIMLGVTGGDVDAITKLRNRRDELRRDLGLA